jgi:diacylglycerol kinase family enzyme
MRTRAAASAALLCAAGAAVLAILVAVRDFPKGLPVVLCAVAAALLAWHSIFRAGRVRSAGLVAAAVLLAGSGALIAVNGRVVEDLVVLGLLIASVATARAAFAVHTQRPTAPRPQHPVLFWNPKSGDGKAVRFRLEAEARARGMEAVELRRGDDLEHLAHSAVARGADALAMAGGDGSQAIVARVAAEHGLPYACIPSGTRNHFALDLGVDRDDVVGALDAFVDGGERLVDLAEINGRVFVNNVSLGFYADAVQKPEYRGAKLRTILDTIGANGGDEHELHWAGPNGNVEGDAPALLVSNNAYRVGTVIGSGTRPQIDAGILGVTVFDHPGAHRGRPWREWTTTSFDVEADHPVNAGIDGEAAVLDPPLRFVSRPAALRVRIARSHPGAAPSATLPDGAWAGVKALVGLVRAGAPAPVVTTPLPADSAGGDSRASTID